MSRTMRTRCPVCHKVYMQDWEDPDECPNGCDNADEDEDIDTEPDCEPEDDEPERDEAAEWGGLDV